jgi:hypothetical protein
MLHLMLHVASVFISRRGKASVGEGGPRMHSSSRAGARGCSSMRNNNRRACVAAAGRRATIVGAIGGADAAAVQHAGQARVSGRRLA